MLNGVFQSNDWSQNEYRYMMHETNGLMIVVVAMQLCVLVTLTLSLLLVFYYNYYFTEKFIFCLI